MKTRLETGDVGLTYSDTDCSHCDDPCGWRDTNVPAGRLWSPSKESLPRGPGSDSGSDTVPGLAASHLTMPECHECGRARWKTISITVGRWENIIIPMTVNGIISMVEFQRFGFNWWQNLNKIFSLFVFHMKLVCWRNEFTILMSYLFSFQVFCSHK